MTPEASSGDGAVEMSQIRPGLVDGLPMGEEQGASAGTPSKRWLKPFVSLLGTAAVLLLVSFWADLIDQVSAPGEVRTISGVFASLLAIDLDQARQTVGNMGEVMAAVLGLALTVSSIIVQLAATRFTPHVTSLFFRAPANMVVNGVFVVGTIFVLWINYAANPAFIPRWGVLLSLVFLTTSLLLLFPYFSYVFSFLEPDSIVGRMANDGLVSGLPNPRNKTHIEVRRKRLVESIENLANIGLNATQQRDKNIASLAADALCDMAIRYGKGKTSLDPGWFELSNWTRQTPDFVSLSNESIGDLKHRKNWVEWKILRQYQMLFNEGLGRMKDLCYLIAINTRRLGVGAARRGDLHTLDLSIKFFNTYLRATINAKDIRTAYNILHQYRQLAEDVLRVSITKQDKQDRADLEARACEVAGFMRYYGGIAFQSGLTFITEVVAHDIGALCDTAYRCSAGVHEVLLDTFLRVDDAAESTEQENTLRGVRRAQVKLATSYLLYADHKFADKIRYDMIEEPRRRLQSIWQELLALDNREFWEVNDRGSNFDYLSPRQKSKLPEFFAGFPSLEDHAPPQPGL
jgi:hypothetical protein